MTPTTLILATLSVFVCEQPGLHDADTWTCRGGLKVRAWGIDAPEVGTPLSPTATRVMARIIKGQDLTCEKRGMSWGRVVAYCTTPEGSDIAAALVRAGYAQDCPAFSRGVYATMRPINGPVLPQRHTSCEVK